MWNGNDWKAFRSSNVTKALSEASIKLEKSDLWPLTSQSGENLNNVLPTEGKPPGNIISRLIYGLKFICEARPNIFLSISLSPPSQPPHPAHRHLHNMWFSVFETSVSRRFFEAMILSFEGFRSEPTSHLPTVRKQRKNVSAWDAWEGRCKFILICERFPSQHFTINCKHIFPSLLSGCRFAWEKNYVHDVDNVDYDVFHISLVLNWMRRWFGGWRRERDVGATNAPP